MKISNFILIKFPGKPGDKNKLPYGPRAYICVKSNTILKCPSKKDNTEFDALSHECTSFQEFEAEADRLIEELQQVKKQGRRFFEKEHKLRNI